MALRASSIFRRSGKAGAALALGVLLAPLGLAAAPLDKDACGKLQAEKQSLTVLGVDKEYAKGPEWAKANLAEAELNLLKRFLVIDEQLKFRCGMVVVTLTVPDEPEDGDDDDGGPASAGVPMPERRDQDASVKPAAKQPLTPARTEPANVKPSPGKSVPKPAAAKAQSFWNAETMPANRVAPAGMVVPLGIFPVPQETVVPKPKTVPRNGDQG